MNFCKIFELNMDDVKVKKIQESSALVTAELFGTIESNDKKSRLRLIYKSLTENLQDELGQINVFFMYMGTENFFRNMHKRQAEIKLNPQFNRIYAPNHTLWQGALRDGQNRGMSYYCPKGWKRWSFYVTENFNQKFDGWCIGYHGTKFQHGLSILLNGMKPARTAVHGKGIYLTPSIIYASNPRYAEIKKIPPEARKFFDYGKYIQFVLECRVPRGIFKICPETLRCSHIRIDPNIRNEEIEWLLETDDNTILDFNDSNSPLACTGLMIRITSDHPGLLPECKWWFQAHSCSENGCSLPIYNCSTLKQKIERGDECEILYSSRTE